MESIKELFRIGNGPSSSHTIAPRNAAEIFLQKFPDAQIYQFILYGSLAVTGHALPSLYRETAAGGLAQIYRNYQAKTEE